MNLRPTRRTMLTAGPLLLASCASGDDYFGKVDRPRSQRLVFQLGAEPDTLDPALSQAGSEEFILPSLFEGLLTLHPTTNEPQAALATHYQSNPAKQSLRSISGETLSRRASGWKAACDVARRRAGATAESLPRTISCIPGEGSSIPRPRRHGRICSIRSAMPRRLMRAGFRSTRSPSMPSMILLCALRCVRRLPGFFSCMTALFFTQCPDT